jgi:sugar phosphate isomerase/epimerase
MQVGISQLVATDPTIDQFFATARDNGYQVVELSMRQQGPLTGQTSAAELDAIAGLSRSCGIPIVSLTLNHWSGNLLALGKEQDKGEPAAGGDKVIDPQISDEKPA